jgi:hypothetical protein
LYNSLNVERDSNNFVVKEAIAVVRKDNTTMNFSCFFSKKFFSSKVESRFSCGDVLRFTGKFALNEEPPHDDILEVIHKLSINYLKKKQKNYYIIKK